MSIDLIKTIKHLYALSAKAAVHAIWFVPILVLVCALGAWGSDPSVTGTPAIVEGRTTALGSVVYVKIINQEGTKSAVYEQALAGGEAKTIISPEALPKEFTGLIESVQPSSDGAYLLLLESRSVIIEEIDTGKTRTVLGSSFAYNPETEHVQREIDSRSWLWERATNHFRLFPAMKTNGFITNDPIWSPKGHDLLQCIYNEKTTKSSYQLLDVGTLECRNLMTSADEVSQYSWAPNGTVLIIVQPVGKSDRILLVALDGKQTVLFTWRRHVVGLAMSPDGQRIALADNQGVYLLTRRGRVLHTLKIVLPEPKYFDATMQFSGTGATLAVLQTNNSGRNVNQELWVVAADTGKAERLGQWQEYLGNEPGGDPCRSLIGWMSDGTQLLIAAYNGTSAGPDTDWRQVWLCLPGQPMRKLFDSGTNTVSMKWLP